MKDTSPLIEYVNEMSEDKTVFGSRFFPRFFYKPFAPFQKESLKKVLESISEISVIFFPRGGGKSQIFGNLCPIILALYHGARYIMLVSQSAERAYDLLSDIKASVESPEFVEVFGNFIGEQWSRKKAHLYSEKWGVDCIIDARGIGAKIRGASSRGSRIDYAILDDIEDDDDVSDPRQVAITERWVTKKLLPALTDDPDPSKRGRVIWLATTIAKDSASIRASEYQGAMTIKFPLMDENDESIWPEMKTTDEARALRERLFSQNMASVWWTEYMMDPRSEQCLTFDENKIMYYKDSDISGRKIPLYMEVDCAYSDRKKADKSAIVVGGFASNTNLYIMDTVSGKFSPEKLLDEIIKLARKYYNTQNKIISIGIESVDYRMISKVLRDRLDSESIGIGIHQLRHRNRTKHDRIRGLIPYLEAMRLYVKRDMQELISQMLRFPALSNDDVLDGAAYLLDNCHVPTEKEVTESMPRESVARAIKERFENDARSRARFSRERRSGGANHVRI
jgi:predicted phage terminase large subunit-like protein